MIIIKNVVQAQHTLTNQFLNKILASYLISVQYFQKWPVDLGVVQKAALDLVYITNGTIELHRTWFGSRWRHRWSGRLWLAWQGQRQSWWSFQGMRGWGALRRRYRFTLSRTNLHHSHWRRRYTAHTAGVALPFARRNLAQHPTNHQQQQGYITTIQIQIRILLERLLSLIKYQILIITIQLHSMQKSKKITSETTAHQVLCMLSNSLWHYQHWG